MPVIRQSEKLSKKWSIYSYNDVHSHLEFNCETVSNWLFLVLNIVKQKLIKKPNISQTID